MAYHQMVPGDPQDPTPSSHKLCLQTAKAEEQNGKNKYCINNAINHSVSYETRTLIFFGGTYGNLYISLFEIE